VLWNFPSPIHAPVSNNVRFSNRPFEVKHFQTIHHCSVDVAHGLALLFGIGTEPLPSWDSRTRWNNLCRGVAVRRTAGPADIRTHLIHRPAIFVSLKASSSHMGIATMLRLDINSTITLIRRLKRLYKVLTQNVFPRAFERGNYEIKIANRHCRSRSNSCGIFHNTLADSCNNG